MSQPKNILVVSEAGDAHELVQALGARGYQVRQAQLGALPELAPAAALVFLVPAGSAWSESAAQLMQAARKAGRPLVAVLAAFDSALRDRFLISGAGDVAPDGEPEDAASKVETLLEGWIRLGRRRKVRSAFKAQRGREVFELPVVDIDAGGMTLASPEGLRRGELLRVALNLPDGPLVLWGRVSADSGQPALRFLGLRSAERRRVAAAVVGGAREGGPAPSYPPGERPGAPSPEQTRHQTSHQGRASVQAQEQTPIQDPHLSREQTPVQAHTRSRNQEQASVQAPRQSQGEIPNQAPNQTPKPAPGANLRPNQNLNEAQVQEQTPLQTQEQIPVQAPTPVQTQEQVPVQAPVPTPLQTREQSPIQAPAPSPPAQKPESAAAAGQVPSSDLAEPATERGAGAAESIADAIGAMLMSEGGGEGGEALAAEPGAGEAEESGGAQSGVESTTPPSVLEQFLAEFQGEAASEEEELPLEEAEELPPAQVWPLSLPDAGEIDLELRTALTFGAVSSESGELGEKILEYCKSISPQERKAWDDEPPEELPDPDLLRRQVGLRFRLRLLIAEATALKAPPEARWELDTELIKQLRDEANALLDEVQKLADSFVAAGELQRMRELNPLRTPISEALSELRRACDRLEGLEEDPSLARLPLDHEERSPDDEEVVRRRPRESKEAEKHESKQPRFAKRRDPAKVKRIRRVTFGLVLSAALAALLVVVQPTRAKRVDIQIAGRVQGVAEVVVNADKAMVRMNYGWMVDPAVVERIRQNLAQQGISSVIVVNHDGRLIAAGKTSAPLPLTKQ